MRHVTASRTPIHLACGLNLDDTRRLANYCADQRNVLANVPASKRRHTHWRTITLHMAPSPCPEGFHCLRTEHGSKDHTHGDLSLNRVPYA